MKGIGHRPTLTFYCAAGTQEPAAFSFPVWRRKIEHCFLRRVFKTFRQQAPMKKLSVILLPLCVLIYGTGCISHEETTYRDVARVPVEFENEAAGRIFYEALSKRGQPRASESRTQVDIPIVFEHKTHEIAGPNYAFNDAVARCDTNKDGKITELEAKIFAGNHPK
jgi:hypothetical protein